MLSIYIELYGARFLFHSRTVFNAEAYIEYLERFIAALSITDKGECKWQRLQQ